MKQTLFAFVTLLFVSSTFAQQAKIIKIKGKQAIVQFKSGQPQVGQILEIAGASASLNEETSLSREHGQRHFIIGISSADLSFLTNSQSSKSTTTLSLSGRFGWNLVEFEAGPLGTFLYRTSDSTSTRTFGAGGFFDYNLVPNKLGTTLVYGVGVEGIYLSTSTSTVSSDSSSSDLEFFGGGNGKWFGLGNHFAIRADAGYYMKRSTNALNTTSTDSGLKVKGSLEVYF